MPDKPQGPARYYRDKAREIRRCAWRVRSPAVRLELFEIAEGFDRMAAHVDKRRKSAPRTTQRLIPSSLYPTLPETGGYPCKLPT
jgi:hypothetical protein